MRVLAHLVVMLAAASLLLAACDDSGTSPSADGDGDGDADADADFDADADADSDADADADSDADGDADGDSERDADGEVDADGDGDPEPVECDGLTPVIVSIDGDARHGAEVILAGGCLGVKDPIEPLLWDDAEAAYGGSPEDGAPVPVGGG